MSLYEVVNISSDESDYDSDATLPLERTAIQMRYPSPINLYPNETIPLESTATQPQYSLPDDFEPDSNQFEFEVEYDQTSQSSEGESGNPDPEPELQTQDLQQQEYSSAWETESLLTPNPLSNYDLQRLAREARQDIDRAREEIRKIEKLIEFKKRVVSFCIVNLPID